MYSFSMLSVMLSSWILVLNGIPYEWYNVTESNIISILEVGVTRLTASSGPDQKFEIKERITNYGCGNYPESRVFVSISDDVDGDPFTKWDKIRYSIQFWGSSECWSLFGNKGYGRPWPTDFSMGLVEFDKDIDTIISNDLLYGSWNGEDAESTVYCDGGGSNFWSTVHGRAGYKGAIRIEQRRDMNASVAGIGGGYSCSAIDDGGDPMTRYYDIMIGYKIQTTSPSAPSTQPSTSPTSSCFDYNNETSADGNAEIRQFDDKHITNIENYFMKDTFVLEFNSSHDNYQHKPIECA
eukprot:223879_1